MEEWRGIQKQTFSSLEKIADFLELDQENRDRLVSRKDFPVHVPLRIASKMKKNSIDNPLALQFLPLKEEVLGGGVLDPVGDGASKRCEALLHKYEGRALLLTTGACAMHCRYCFRQNFPYKSALDEAVEIISKDPSIKEIILSGGDPLSLSDRALKELFDKFEKIPHVEIVRFHTRFVVGIPERITDAFLDILRGSCKQIVFVVHVNCVEELDEDIFCALARVGALNIPVLTQTVLLRDVNDSKKALYDLFWALSKRGVIPYYLHQLDRVKGSLHFEVSKERGRELILALRDCMPGYAVPTYVEERAGDGAKHIIGLERTFDREKSLPLV